MILPFAVETSGRPGYGLPEGRLINFMVEPSSGPTKLQLVPRPGILGTGANASTPSAEPVRGMFYQSGAFSNSLFVVTGTTAWISQASPSNLGTIPGADNVRFASSAEQLVAIANGQAFYSTGGAFALGEDEDLPAVVDVIQLAGRFVYAAQDSGKFYWSALNDATSVDGLAFSTAESEPDNIVGMGVFGDEMMLFGSKTTELWYSDGTSADQPFLRSQGRRYERGCVNRDTIVNADNTLFWVGENLEVYRASQVPQRISTHAIEVRLTACTDLASLVAWSITVEGHELYGLQIPGQGTFVYDISNGKWSEWQTGGSVFDARHALMVESVPYVGGYLGAVADLSSNLPYDATANMLRLASGFIPLPAGNMRCNSVMLQCSHGLGISADPITEALVELRWSDDQGRTWSNWTAQSNGSLGNYTVKPIWRTLGMMDSPGRVFEVRTSDRASVTFSGLVVNEFRP